MAKQVRKWNKRFLPKPIRKAVTLTEFLLEKLVPVMQEEPARVDQRDWLRTGEDAVCVLSTKYNPLTGDYEPVKTVAPACGTVGCTAGWASVLLGYKAFPTAGHIANDLGLHIVENRGETYETEDHTVPTSLFGSSGYGGGVTAPGGTKLHMQQVVKGIKEYVKVHKDVADRILVYPKGRVR